MNITEFLEARITEDEARAEGELGAEYFTEGAWPEEVADRMLAECAAKRAIIGWVNDWPLRAATFDSMNGVLETLAAVYRSHPDYRQEWAL